MVTTSSFKLAASQNCRHVSGTEVRLLIDKPAGWEYLLFGHAMGREISAASDTKRDWAHGIALGRHETMGAREFMKFCSQKNSEAVRTAALVEDLFRILRSSADPSYRRSQKPFKPPRMGRYLNSRCC